MTDETVVTAVEDEAEANTTDSEQDIDSLLAEFDEKVETAPVEQPKAEPTPQKGSDDDTAVLVDFARTQMAAAHENAVMDTAKSIKGRDETLADLDDDVLRDLLEMRASRDRRIADAWNARSEKPGAWEAIEKSLAKEFGEKLGARPDPQLTSDRESVRASTRGMSTTEPPGSDEIPYRPGMSDAEFRQMKKGLGG